MEPLPASLSSPRKRGSNAIRLDVALHRRVIPAQAGIQRQGGSDVTKLLSHPRASGDPTLSVGANGVRPPATHWLDSRFRGNDGTGRPCSKHNAGLFRQPTAARSRAVTEDRVVGPRMVPPGCRGTVTAPAGGSPQADRPLHRPFSSNVGGCQVPVIPAQAGIHPVHRLSGTESPLARG